MGKFGHRKSRTILSEKFEFSSLNIELTRKLGLGKLGQFDPRSPRCPRRPSFRPGLHFRSLESSLFG